MRRQQTHQGKWHLRELPMKRHVYTQHHPSVLALPSLLPCPPDLTLFDLKKRYVEEQRYRRSYYDGNTLQSLFTNRLHFVNLREEICFKITKPFLKKIPALIGIPEGLVKTIRCGYAIGLAYRCQGTALKSWRLIKKSAHWPPVFSTVCFDHSVYLSVCVSADASLKESVSVHPPKFAYQMASIDSCFSIPDHLSI